MRPDRRRFYVGLSGSLLQLKICSSLVMRYCGCQVRVDSLAQFVIVSIVENKRIFRHSIKKVFEFLSLIQINLSRVDSPS
jgi:hypothetical protein